MGTIRILDVTDAATFGRIPPCADPGFDHRSCDYWEDADRGSKAARLSWLEPVPAASATARGRRPTNPFLADLEAEGAGRQPVRDRAPGQPVPDAGRRRRPGPSRTRSRRRRRRARRSPPTRRASSSCSGAGSASSAATRRSLLEDDVGAAYAQFGPLTAYPRAQRTRDLYPSLPDAPLPAVITCIATTAEARGAGLATGARRGRLRRPHGARVRGRRDLPGDRCAARTRRARRPRGFWESVGFAMAIADERFPVMRRALA